MRGEKKEDHDLRRKGKCNQHRSGPNGCCTACANAAHAHFTQPLPRSIPRTRGGNSAIRLLVPHFAHCSNDGCGDLKIIKVYVSKNKDRMVRLLKNSEISKKESIFWL